MSDPASNVVKLHPTAHDEFVRRVTPFLAGEVENFVLLVKSKGEDEYAFAFDSGEDRDRFGLAGRLMAFAHHLTAGMIEEGE